MTDAETSRAEDSGRARFRASKSPRRVKVNLPLRFCHEVLGLDHLHYGLWDGEPLGLEGLESAQQRYTETLLEWIPEGVESVLDVGCGTGATGRELRDRGFAVEGLSPDPYQQELFARRVGRPFHLGRFQEFEPAKPYDLVLMSESSQYIWLDSLFPAVRRAAPGGHLLVADYFTVDAGDRAGKQSGHPLADYLEAAAAAGLELLRQEDVTERTLPTLELAGRWQDEYIDPSLTMLGDHFAANYPRLFRCGRWLLGGWIGRKLGSGRREMDAAEFRRHKCYQLLLFKVNRG
ncbi:MAG: class I SAM-dependent methyltransferase [Thermoanaerobaculia bacterium]